MATVFLAHDLKHDRDVAIKVLEPDLARSIASERFLREIGITARLNHPHVLPLLDSGVAGDGELLYYVMPLVTGESLRDRLARDGRLPIDEVAAPRDRGHRRARATRTRISVVHRDVKPDNVMLSGGHAVVVDFGIAKAVGEAREDATLTSEGMSLGTPAYMAPEQAAGERDRRSSRRRLRGGRDAVRDAALARRLRRHVAADRDGEDGEGRAVARVRDGPTRRRRSCDSSRAAFRAIPPSGRDGRSAVRELHALAAPAAAPRDRARTRSPRASSHSRRSASRPDSIVRERRTAWVRATAIPTIQRLIDADQLDSAFALASEAERARAE